MKILVTGSSGFLAENIMKQAADGRHTALGVSVSPLVKGVTTSKGELHGQEKLRGIIKNYRPDTIIHCAAYTDVDGCEQDPDYAYLSNIALTQTLAQISAEISSFFIYISTDSVFDGHSGDYTEQDSVNPRNIYASTKYQGEREALATGGSVHIARVNFYGCSSRKKHLTDWILSNIDAGNTITGYRNVIFSPLYVEDLACYLLFVAEQKLSGVYHYASLDAISKYEFAAHIAQTLVGSDECIIEGDYVHAEGKARRPLNTSLDSSKLQEVMQSENASLVVPTIKDSLSRFLRMIS